MAVYAFAISSPSCCSVSLPAAWWRVEQSIAVVPAGHALARVGGRSRPARLDGPLDLTGQA